MFRLLRLLSYPLSAFLWKGIWHSVYFFLCRPKLSIMLFLVGVGWLIYSIWIAEGNGVVILPEPEEKIAEKKLIELPPFSEPIKNGNSRFSSSLSSLLDLRERKFYSYHFQTAMSYSPVGDEYIWKAHDKLFGQVTVKKHFFSKSGVACRDFEETTQTPKGSQKLTGISCMYKNGNGWCKLRKSSALTCEIKPVSGWTNWKLDTKSWVRRNFSSH